jgi:hypothetical protein
VDAETGILAGEHQNMEIAGSTGLSKPARNVDPLTIQAMSIRHFPRIFFRPCLLDTMRNNGIIFGNTAQSFPHGVALYLEMPCNQLRNWLVKLFAVRTLLVPTKNRQRGRGRAVVEP